MTLLRFFLPLVVVDFLPLANKGLSDLERQIVPRSLLKFTDLGENNL